MAQDKDFTYDSTPPTPGRTVDRPFTPAHADALNALRALVDKDEAGDTISEPMAAPHLGARMSQRKAARWLLAGRSYQAVQAWLAGEPMPASMVDFLTKDLQRIDARAEDRMVRVAVDEIAIVVKISERGKQRRPGELSAEQLRELSAEDLTRHQIEHPLVGNSLGPDAAYGKLVFDECERRRREAFSRPPAR